MALMPAETSAQIANATNGIEPPRSLISIKQSKHGVLKQVVPEYKRLKTNMTCYGINSRQKVILRLWLCYRNILIKALV